MSKLYVYYLLNVIICLLTVDKRRPNFIQVYWACIFYATVAIVCLTFCVVVFVQYCFVVV